MKRTRILVKVFLGTELGWIYENTNNRGSMGSCKAPGTIDEGQVAFMEGTHGGNEDQRSRQTSAEAVHAG